MDGREFKCQHLGNCLEGKHLMNYYIRCVILCLPSFEFGVFELVGLKSFKIGFAGVSHDKYP